ncbi:MAG: DUF4384 domain-containing protein, partial [Pyrinomonadaceae bacterium]
APAGGSSLTGSASTGTSTSNVTSTGGGKSTVGVTGSTGKSTTTGRTSTGRTSTGRTSTGRTSTGRTSTGKTTGGTTTAGTTKNYANQPIGLGYSIYMRDGSGSPVRTDPNRSFIAGDAIRIALETNIDGYLYVFHTENDGAPEMIFPDARLSGGKNWVDAHVPREVPSSQEIEPSYRWFTFDNKPAVERLYIVVARQPLVGIPTGADLVKLCAKAKNTCPLKMSETDWSQVKFALQSRVVVSKMTVYGQAETTTERESTARGLGLPADAPAPTVVRMSAVSTDKALVTAIDLIHN